MSIDIKEATYADIGDSSGHLLTTAISSDLRLDQDSIESPISMLRRIIPGYVVRPHLEVIAEKMKDVLSGEIDRLLIMLPPQSGKTLTAVIGGSVWWLANRPDARVIIGSYGDSLAIDRGRDSRKIIVEHGQRFNLRLSRGSEAVQDWRLTTNGGVLSVGIGAGVTGKPGDIAFIDDPHKSRAEADSLRFRDRAYKWLSADIISRLSPRAPVIMIMTPWHIDDLAARVLENEGSADEGGRWHVVRIPAFCDNPDSDPLGRAVGAPLPHPKIKIDDIDAAERHWHDKRRSSTVQDWHSLYMCDPKPAEGALLTYDILRRQRCYTSGSACYPCNIEPMRVAVAVDPSGGGRDVAGIIGGYLGSDRRLYFTRDESSVMSSEQWARKTCEMAMEIDADVIIFEKNFGGDMAGKMIRTAWASLQAEERDIERQRIIEENPSLTAREVERAIDSMELNYSALCPLIKSVSAKMSKRLRADPIAQQWKEDRIRTAKYLPELEQEWATWQEDSSNSPGRIDASVYLAYALLPAPKAGTGGSAAPHGSMPSTGFSPLSSSSGGGSTFGPLAR